MNYQLISKSEPRARKEYDCIWCVDKIAKGESHVHEVSRYNDDFQDHRWHHECLAIAVVYYRESGGDEFEPHACKRGSMEEA